MRRSVTVTTGRWRAAHVIDRWTVQLVMGKQNTYKQMYSLSTVSLAVPIGAVTVCVCVSDRAVLSTAEELASGIRPAGRSSSLYWL